MDPHPATPEAPLDGGADARIQALQSELAAARAEMQHFAFAVSHDLRAPLRHILAYAQMVQEDAGEQLDAEVQGFLGTITDSARHMGAMLEGLAQWSRVGTTPVQPQSIDLQVLVGEVCAELASMVVWRVAIGLPTVSTDLALARLALAHVIGNAVKFSPAGATVVIAPWIDGSRGLAGVTIQDLGAGFDPTQQQALFKVFGRLHSAQKFPGIGIGLAITRRIMDRLGGDVEIVSAGAGQGATVTLGWPRAGGGAVIGERFSV